MPPISAARVAALLALACALGLAAEPARAACDCSTLPTLGRALDYPATSTFTEVTVSGGTWAENGNVAIGNKLGLNGKLTVSGSAVVQAIFNHPGTTVTNSTGNPIPVTQQDMSGVVADIEAANTAFAALTPTQTFASITATTTITGNGCINVIRVTGDLSISAGKVLTLKGGYDDYFIINIGGEFKVSSTKIVFDGVEPEHVIYNQTGGLKGATISGSAAIYGTILNPYQAVTASGGSSNRGAFYAGKKLTLSGSTSWYGKPFRCTSGCPSPENTGQSFQTPPTPSGRSTGNTPYYYPYFDTTSFEGHLESFRVNFLGKIKDMVDADALDSSTHKFKSTRTPYWDAGVLLRTDTTRNVYTSKAGARVDWNATNVTQADLDLQTGELPAYPGYPANSVDTLGEFHTAVIRYVEGRDGFDEDADANFTELRPTVLGDIFRSNVLFIGSPTTQLAFEPGYDDFLTDHGHRDRVVYAGANDALLHGFDAGAWWNPADPTAFNPGSGAELFGYAPGLLLPVAKLTARDIDATGKRLVPGFLDGALVAADAWLGDGSGSDVTKTAEEWATVLVSSFREGGKGYLALDITEPGATSGTHAPYPKLLWEFADADLGQTWSRAVITRVKLRGASGSGDHCGASNGDGDCREQWVVIFGGGVEPTGDPNHPDYISDPANAAWTNQSKALYIVALDSGDILAKVEFDSTGVNGPSTMKYSFASEPAVLDLDGDLFADVVYIPDLGGNLWKWDLSTAGEDTNVDSLIDNWPAGIYFNAPEQDMGGGKLHYRSFYNAPSAAYVNKMLHLAFGSGERRDLLYAGNAGLDDNNRFYVIQDPHPTGASAFSTVVTEANLTNATTLGSYVNPGNLGYYLVAPEGEKFVTDSIVFAGQVLVGSYKGEVAPTCGPGAAYFYAFKLDDARGFFDANNTAEAADRRVALGIGIPSNPRVTVAPNPSDDTVWITTSQGQVLEVEPPLRPGPESSVIYWRPRY